MKNKAHNLATKVVIVLVLCHLAGCMPMAVKRMNERKKEFPDLGVSKVEAIVNEPIRALRYKSLVYLKLNAHGPFDVGAYQRLVKDAFRKFNFFERVVLPSQAININYSPKIGKTTKKKTAWHDLRDNRTLHDIYEQYGPREFLIAEGTLRQVTEGPLFIKKITFSLKFIEPKSRRVVFYAKDEAHDWLGADLTVIYPVINVANGWLVYSAGPKRPAKKAV